MVFPELGSTLTQFQEIKNIVILFSTSKSWHLQTYLHHSCGRYRLLRPRIPSMQVSIPRYESFQRGTSGTLDPDPSLLQQFMNETSKFPCAMEQYCEQISSDLKPPIYRSLQFFHGVPTARRELVSDMLRFWPQN